MHDVNRTAPVSTSSSTSPYLMRPLRTREQALADIAAAKGRANTVTAFVPLAIVSSERITKSRIAA